MTPGQTLAATATVVGLAAAACAAWASIAESDAPGWRSHAAAGGAALSVVFLFTALAVD